MALVKSPEVEYRIFNEIVLTTMSESYVWVETEPQLQELANVLSKERIFAVDTEQHSFRSFLGFTALIQISTQKEDYLIDTIALHDAMDIIRPVFSDPTVLKVFHGADNDVLWLQRDFHLYVVNLFDTAKACEVLSKPHKSLAYLLETCCGVITNKSFQREDWRQRPLPEEMLEYARSDAHYLLYIARWLLDELRQRGNACQDDTLHFLLEASRRSNTTCLQLYSKDDEAFPGETIASSILSRNLTSQGIESSKLLDTQFQNNVRRLCAWRDLMARVHDESLRYILSDQAIVALADKSPVSETEIYDIVSEADQNNDSLPACLISISPSPVICSHWEDIPGLLKDGGSTSDDILQKLLIKHLGPSGTCSLSIYNDSLLSRSNLKYESRSISKPNGLRTGKQFGRKASRELFVKKFSCKAPVYHNCRIYASDGRLLCYCDRRKLEWYLSRNLAKLVDEDPPAIMLLFEPKGRPEDEDNDFYIQSKRNMCVGCGERNHYLRYRIIPSCYRVHFPEHLKSHRSHDIVLLCVDCHEVAHAAAEKYKRQVAAEFGVPLYVRKVVDPGQKQATEESELHENDEAGVSPLQLRTAAMALLRHGTRMPSNRRQELIEIVKTYYGGRDISYQDLEAALLVGMSPHERRKFEKKRALSNEHSAASVFAGLVLGNNSDSKTSSIAASGAGDINDQASSEQPDDKLERDVQNPSLSSELEAKHNARAIDDGSEAFGSSENSELKDAVLSDVESNYESINPSNKTHNLSVPNADGRNHNSKLSLLGHGPHGKEVVTHLLEKRGEDGIREFCQKWRQVFVDAVHPRFLPAGWDIKHSGKRDFGEFSVYNPAKNPAGTS